MSMFIGTVRVSFDHDDCYVLEVGTGGRVYLLWRPTPDESRRAYNQQQLNDTLAGLRRIANSAGLEWPAEVGVR